MSDATVALLTMIDNAGVARTKAVPTTSLEAVAKSGVGISYVTSVFCADDAIAQSPGRDTPSGDMRLVPDLDAVVAVHESPLLWAPVWQLDQDMMPMPTCGRHILGRVVDALAEAGLRADIAYETEFTLFRRDGGATVHTGPGYSPLAFLEAEDFGVALVAALEAQGIGCQQFHAEYSPGQYEVSIPHRGPLAAADALVLTRFTVHRLAKAHGHRASFSPRPAPDIPVGNGCHLHISLWRNDDNLFSDLDAATSPSVQGLAAIGGILAHLRGIQAVLTPSVPSYERLQPHHWSGAYTCWGRENREAAIRHIEGSAPARPTSANIELKPVDGAANPYLAAAVALTAALDGIQTGIAAPEPVSIDPDALPAAERDRIGIHRLPEDLGAAVEAMDADGLAAQLFGDLQYQAFRAVRLSEWERYKDLSREQVIEAHRWVY